MKLKTYARAVAIKAKQRRKGRKGLAKSYVSLFLVLMFALVSTFAWFTQYKSATVNSQVLEFQSASSLRINKGKQVSNTIEIDDFVLDEASSYDGRNIYFPLGASFTEETANMFFREGNRGDENVHYVYKDFDLKGTSGNTPVYIKSYKITIADGDEVHDTKVNGVYQDELEINYTNNVPTSQVLPVDCPIRIAFIADSGMNPVVIDPSAQVIDYVENSNAVTLVDDNGVPMTAATKADSFATYYFGNTPLFIIPGGQNLPVTMVVWLEGTLGNCHKYIGKKISVDVDIESNFAEMETIKFVDGTLPDNDNGQQHWVSNDNPIIACSYKDPFSSEGRWKTVIMRKSNEDYTWTAQIPKKAVENISFYRLSKASDEEDKNEREGTIYNSWHTSPNIAAMLGNANIPNNWYRSGSQDLQKTRQFTDEDGNSYNALVYTAVHGNGWSVTSESAKRLSPCVGYWNYSGGSGGGDSGGGGSGGGDSGGGGGSSESSYKIGVYVNTKDWVDQNVQSGSKLWFYTENGQNKQLNRTGSKYFSWQGNLDAGDKIVGFYVKHSSGQTNISVSAAFTVKREYNVTYDMADNDILMPRATE